MYRRTYFWSLFLVIVILGGIFIFLFNEGYVIVSEFLKNILNILVPALILIIPFIGAFSELASFIDSIIDRFENSKYLQELCSGPYDKETIYRNTRFYVHPSCSDRDPSCEQELRSALYIPHSDLFRAVDYFLNNPTITKHLLLLGDTGTGKTAFTINYYAYRKSRHNKRNILLVPLGDKKALSYIKAVDDKKNTIVILDAFDEDANTFTHEGYSTRLEELMTETKDFNKIILTCRTQFFANDEDIPNNTGLPVTSPRKPGDSAYYHFITMYLFPFDDRQIKYYLKKRYSLLHWYKRQKAFDVVDKIPLLSVRQMILAYIPDLIESNVDIHSTRVLYRLIIESWIEREERWINKEYLLNISKKLAIHVYLFRQGRGGEFITLDEINKICDDKEFKIDSVTLRSRSLLNRDADGNYKFSHRSIMEYLFIESYVDNLYTCFTGFPFTGFMKNILREIVIEDNRILRKFSTYINAAEIIPVSNASDLINIDSFKEYTIEDLQISVEMIEKLCHLTSLEEQLIIGVCGYEQKLAWTNNVRSSYFFRKEERINRVLLEMEDMITTKYYAINKKQLRRFINIIEAENEIKDIYLRKAIISYLLMQLNKEVHHSYDFELDTNLHEQYFNILYYVSLLGINNFSVFRKINRSMPIFIPLKPDYKRIILVLEGYHKMHL